MPFAPRIAFALVLLTMPFASALGAVEDTYDVWLKHFYQTQDVSQFDGFWKMVIRERILENKNALPPTIGFASQVLHKYPALLKDRLDQPSAFPATQSDPVLEILWLSDTKEARAILQQAGHQEYLERSPPPIGGWEIKSGGDLDLCWGWYFATGDMAALDPIVSALDLGQYAGALKRYPTSPKKEEDRQAAIKDAIFGAAMWSLTANGRDNPDIARRIRILFFAPHTPQARRLWLGVIFTKVSPDVPVQELENNKAGH